MKIGSALMDCDKIQHFANTLPREHRNTPWVESVRKNTHGEWFVAAACVFLIFIGWLIL